MAKKKTPKISLEGFEDINFNQEPDIKAAQSIIEPEKKAKAVEPKPKIARKPKPTPKPKPKPITAQVPVAKKQKTPSTAKGTMPPANKKRASFNIDEDLHRALKNYSFFNEIEMVEYVFNQLVKNDLANKGYYPPKKRK